MKTIDLLYIHPSKSINKIGYCIIPLGTISIINYLKKHDISVVGLNYPMERSLNKKFNLQQFLLDKKFHLIAIDLHWHQLSFGAIEMAKLVKKIYSSTPIVFGGYTASFFAKEILKKFKEIDFIIKGDGNIPLLKLIQNIKSNKNSYDDVPNLVYRRQNYIIENSKNFILQDLDNLNFTDINFLHNYKYYYRTHLHYFGEKIPFFIICIASGCLYNCISCGGSRYSTENILKRNLLIRSVEKIVKDLEYLYTIGIKKVWVSHDIQCLGKKNWNELFYLLRKNNIKIGLVTDIWQTIDDDFLSEFSATVEKKYSTFTISPFSGCEKIRREFGKFYDNKKFMESILKIKNEGISLEIYFSYYLPFEEYREFFQTMSFTNNIIRSYPANILTVYYYPASLDPGSILFDNAEEYNVKLVKKDFMDFYIYSNKSEFLYKIDKKMIGYKLKNSNIHPLLLYILWFYQKTKILFNKLVGKIKR